MFDDLPSPLVTIPGNHDIGFYGEEEQRPARLAAFVETWGGDRFSIDAAGWRLVGANAYLLGEPDHDAWLAESVAVERPIAVFIHQPVVDERRDGWEMPPAAIAAFNQAVDGADVRLVASGHRHRYADRGRDVWAPSTTIPGEQRDEWSDPRLGAVEFTFRADGTFESPPHPRPVRWSRATAAYMAIPVAIACSSNTTWLEWFGAALDGSMSGGVPPRNIIEPGTRWST